MSSESDRLLVRQIRQGGAAAMLAWEDLVGRYEGRLRSYVRRRLLDSSTTDDTVQETFIGFLNSLPNFDEQRDLQMWLFTIASYKVTDQLRRMGRRLTPSGQESDDEHLARHTDDRQRGASSVARGREKLEMEQAAISRALRELIIGFQRKSEYVRVQVLELLFVKGWPNWQVADFLKLTEQQVANYRFAAVRKLTEAMRVANLPPEIFPELVLPNLE